VTQRPDDDPYFEDRARDAEREHTEARLARADKQHGTYPPDLTPGRDQ
jgi:hypothetical protein